MLLLDVVSFEEWVTHVEHQRFGGGLNKSQNRKEGNSMLKAQNHMQPTCELRNIFAKYDPAWEGYRD